MKEFIEEFKKFINRGSVVDLAVGVIIGGAFTTIVNSLVGDVIMPIIGALIGGFDFTSITINLGGESVINIGTFIQNVVDFVIVAFVVFIGVRAINKVKEKQAKKQEAVEEAKPDPEDIVLLRSIEKELKKLNKNKK